MPAAKTTRRALETLCEITDGVAKTVANNMLTNFHERGYHSELSRLVSFRCFPHSDLPLASPEALARAGFFFSPGWWS